MEIRIPDDIIGQIDDERQKLVDRFPQHAKVIDAVLLECGQKFGDRVLQFEDVAALCPEIDAFESLKDVDPELLRAIRAVRRKLLAQVSRLSQSTQKPNGSAAQATAAQGEKEAGTDKVTVTKEMLLQWTDAAFNRLKSKLVDEAEHGSERDKQAVADAIEIQRGTLKGRVGHFAPANAKNCADLRRVRNEMDGIIEIAQFKMALEGSEGGNQLMAAIQAEYRKTADLIRHVFQRHKAPLAMGALNSDQSADAMFARLEGIKEQNIHREEVWNDYQRAYFDSTLECGKGDRRFLEGAARSGQEQLKSIRREFDQVCPQEVRSFSELLRFVHILNGRLEYLTASISPSTTVGMWENFRRIETEHYERFFRKQLDRLAEPRINLDEQEVIMDRQWALTNPRCVIPLSRNEVWATLGHAFQAAKKRISSLIDTKEKAAQKGQTRLAVNKRFTTLEDSTRRVTEKYCPPALPDQSSLWAISSFLGVSIGDTEMWLDGLSKTQLQAGQIQMILEEEMYPAIQELASVANVLEMSKPMDALEIPINTTEEIKALQALSPLSDYPGEITRKEFLKAFESTWKGIDQALAASDPGSANKIIRLRTDTFQVMKQEFEMLCPPVIRDFSDIEPLYCAINGLVEASTATSLYRYEKNAAARAIEQAHFNAFFAAVQTHLQGLPKPTQIAEENRKIGKFHVCKPHEGVHPLQKDNLVQSLQATIIQGRDKLFERYRSQVGKMPKLRPTLAVFANDLRQAITEFADHTCPAEIDSPAYLQGIEFFLHDTLRRIGFMRVAAGDAAYETEAQEVIGIMKAAILPVLRQALQDLRGTNEDAERQKPQTVQRSELCRVCDMFVYTIEQKLEESDATYPGLRNDLKSLLGELQSAMERALPETVSTWSDLLKYEFSDEVLNVLRTQVSDFLHRKNDEGHGYHAVLTSFQIHAALNSIYPILAAEYDLKKASHIKLEDLIPKFTFAKMRLQLSIMYVAGDNAELQQALLDQCAEAGKALESIVRGASNLITDRASLVKLVKTVQATFDPLKTLADQLDGNDRKILLDEIKLAHEDILKECDIACAYDYKTYPLARIHTPIDFSETTKAPAHNPETFWVPYADRLAGYFLRRCVERCVASGNAVPLKDQPAMRDCFLQCRQELGQRLRQAAENVCRASAPNLPTSEAMRTAMSEAAWSMESAIAALPEAFRPIFEETVIFGLSELFTSGNELSFCTEGPTDFWYSQQDLSEYLTETLGRLLPPPETSAEALARGKKAVSNAYAAAVVDRLLGALVQGKEAVEDGNGKTFYALSRTDFSLAWVDTISTAAHEAVNAHLGTVSLEGLPQQTLERFFVGARRQVFLARVGSTVERTMLSHGVPQNICTALRGADPDFQSAIASEAPISEPRTVCIERVFAGRSNAPLFQRERELFTQFCRVVFVPGKGIDAQLQQHRTQLEDLALRCNETCHAGEACRTAQGLLETLRTTAEDVIRAKEEETKKPVSTEKPLPPHIEQLRRLVEENQAWIATLPDGNRSRQAIGYLEQIFVWHDDASDYMQRYRVLSEAAGDSSDARWKAQAVATVRKSGAVEMQPNGGGKHTLKVERPKLRALFASLEDQQRSILGAKGGVVAAVAVEKPLQQLLAVGKELQELQTWLAESPNPEHQIQQIESEAAQLASVEQFLSDQEEFLNALPTQAGDLLAQLQAIQTLLAAAARNLHQDIQRAEEQERNTTTSLAEQTRAGKNPQYLGEMSARLARLQEEVLSLHAFRDGHPFAQWQTEAARLHKAMQENSGLVLPSGLTLPASTTEIILPDSRDYGSITDMWQGCRTNARSLVERCEEIILHRDEHERLQKPLSDSPGREQQLRSLRRQLRERKAAEERVVQLTQLLEQISATLGTSKPS